jgi:hypothetical protein
MSLKEASGVDRCLPVTFSGALIEQILREREYRGVAVSDRSPAEADAQIILEKCENTRPSE